MKVNLYLKFYMFSDLSVIINILKDVNVFFAAYYILKRTLYKSGNNLCQTYIKLLITAHTPNIKKQ
nr:hypothetical protein B11C_110093 [Bartonella sp. 1-1C]